MCVYSQQDFKCEILANKTRGTEDFLKEEKKGAIPACLELLCVQYLLREREEGRLDYFQKSEREADFNLEGC